MATFLYIVDLYRLVACGRHQQLALIVVVDGQDMRHWATFFQVFASEQLGADKLELEIMLNMSKRATLARARRTRQSRGESNTKPTHSPW